MIDHNLLPMFMAVAEAENFRTAADRLGVTRSSVSQGIRRLEDNLGAALVVRTTRAVRLPEAGDRLGEAISRPYSEIRAALEDVNEEAPTGTFAPCSNLKRRTFPFRPLIAAFDAAQPGVTIDITVTDIEFDIVAAGFDAGVRLGEVIEPDMIAIPLTGDQREAAVASPVYLAEHGQPEHPRNLVDHRCIGWRLAPGSPPYRQELRRMAYRSTLQLSPRSRPTISGSCCEVHSPVRA